jgi:hypothetical protein
MKFPESRYGNDWRKALSKLTYQTLERYEDKVKWSFLRKYDAMNTPTRVFYELCTKAAWVVLLYVHVWATGRTAGFWFPAGARFRSFP